MPLTSVNATYASKICRKTFQKGYFYTKFDFSNTKRILLATVFTENSSDFMILFIRLLYR